MGSFARKLKRKQDRDLQKQSLRADAIMPTTQDLTSHPIFKAGYKTAEQVTWDMCDLRMAMNETLVVLRVRCAQMDAVIKTNLVRKQLQDALKLLTEDDAGENEDEQKEYGILKGIRDAYKWVVEDWEFLQELGRKSTNAFTNLPDFDKFRPDIKASVDRRIEGLKALKDKNDDTLIRNIPPIDLDIDTLFGSVIQHGRQRKPEDWHVNLGKRWQEVESKHPDGIKPNDVRHELLKPLADWSNGSWIMKQGLSDDEKRMFESLNSNKAKRDTSTYRNWLLGNQST